MRQESFLLHLHDERTRLICLRHIVYNRRFSGDESFLDNPNGFNDGANEKNEARPRL